MEPSAIKYLDPANSSHIVRSYAEQINTEESFRLGYDVDKSSGRLLMASASALDRGGAVDVSWLAAASEKYKISADIRDYVIAEVPIVEGDIPNRNMHCFLTSRLVEFVPDRGVQAYKTFVGMPVHYEHQHNDITKAKGVILDASMRCINGRWFVVILKAFDRSKDRSLAEQIRSGKRKGHSMSAWTSFFDCGHCGHRWDTKPENACQHVLGDIGRRTGTLSGLGNVIDDRLVYAITAGFTFFESSTVGDPAAWVAHQTQQKALS